MRGRTFVGFLLILLGTGFLLDRLDVIQFSTLMEIYWPVFLILIGAGQLFSEKRPSTMGIALILAGLFFTLNNLNIIPGDIKEYFWPILLIIIGLFIIFGKSIYDKTPEYNDDTLDYFAIFSGLKGKCTSKNFKGGDITAIFGGAELDLRHACLSEGKALLNLTVVFGGADIKVPSQWKVIIKGIPIFGGWENKTDTPTNVPEDVPVLNIKCLAIFGGINIKN